MPTNDLLILRIMHDLDNEAARCTEMRPDAGIVNAYAERQAKHGPMRLSSYVRLVAAAAIADGADATRTAAMILSALRFLDESGLELQKKVRTATTPLPSPIPSVLTGLNPTDRQRGTY
jgi:hypothetical protein